MTRFLIAAAAACLPTLAAAEGGPLSAADAYALSGNPQSGAIFMTLANAGDTACTVTSARGDVAERVELHTHLEVDGVMKMVEVKDGFLVPAKGERALARGGDHVMLLGIKTPLADGDKVAVTLVSDCGDLAVEAVVDNARKPAPMMMQHGHDQNHGDHGAMPAPSN